MEMQAEVKRGPESWNYIYVALGFLLAIEGDLIQLMQLSRWAGLLTYGILAAITIYLFLCNGWFQNKLTGLKTHTKKRGGRKAGGKG